MRGPRDAYAINGHDRTYHAYSFQLDPKCPHRNGVDETRVQECTCKRVHRGTVCVFSTEIRNNGVITRNDLAAILREWRNRGYNIRRALNHYHPTYGVCGPKRCTYCNGADARLQKGSAA